MSLKNLMKKERKELLNLTIAGRVFYNQSAN